LGNNKKLEVKKIDLGKFIVLEGIDGVGKTTLAEKIDGQNDCIYVKRKQVSSVNEFVDGQMLKHNKLLWTENHGADDHLLPTKYWITMQSAWYLLLTNFVIDPILKEGKNVIVDGWYYKLIARTQLQGEEQGYVKTVFSPIKKPDVVILLNEKPENVWNRKKEFRSYEFGKFKDSNIEESKKSFIEYQNGTYNNLIKMLENNWIVLNLKNRNIEECCQLVTQELKKILKGV